MEGVNGREASYLPAVLRGLDPGTQEYWRGESRGRVGRQTVKRAPSEAAIKKAIIKWLNMKQAYVLALHAGPTLPPGTPDLLTIIHGIPWFIECKRPGGRLTKHQERTLKKMQRKGIPCMVAYSLQDVKDFYERYLETDPDMV